jgi:RNA polymerase sigma factor (sigma-70 family)
MSEEKQPRKKARRKPAEEGPAHPTPANNGVTAPLAMTTQLLYHFCRLRLPAVPMPLAVFEKHLERAFEMYRTRQEREGGTPTREAFLANLYAPDWFLACACLEKQPRAWDELFAARANRTDSLLIDALRARAVRLFPRDIERQEEAVLEFWGFLLAGNRDGSLSVLERYDGQRPLVPWLIRVFQNKHLSELRHRHFERPVPDEELDERLLPPAGDAHERWYEEFRQAAHDWLGGRPDNEVLILGLRLRYRLSQREVAALLGIHEGNVSRQTTHLSDDCVKFISRRLEEAGWTGEDLDGFISKEMDSLLLDEPRLAADRLAALLAARRPGAKLPPPSAAPTDK